MIGFSFVTPPPMGGVLHPRPQRRPPRRSPASHPSGVSRPALEPSILPTSRRAGARPGAKATPWSQASSNPKRTIQRRRQRVRHVFRRIRRACPPVGSSRPAVRSYPGARCQRVSVPALAQVRGWAPAQSRPRPRGRAQLQGWRRDRSTHGPSARSFRGCPATRYYHSRHLPPPTCVARARHRVCAVVACARPNHCLAGRSSPCCVRRLQSRCQVQTPSLLVLRMQIRLWV